VSSAVYHAPEAAYDYAKETWTVDPDEIDWAAPSSLGNGYSDRRPCAIGVRVTADQHKLPETSTF
jgi:hypothetical protein